jgi:DNA replication protein DnaC
MGLLSPKSDEFLLRFNLAGGAWVTELTPPLLALRSQDPARFDDLRATYEQRFRQQEAEERARQQEVLDAGERQRKRERKERLKRAGARLGDSMVEACVADSLSPTEALKAVRGWYESRSTPWLIVSGGTGCGKTVAAASLVAGITGAAWFRADDLVRAFAGFFGDAAERQEHAKNAPLLVLDDVGGELDAARMLPALLELLDARLSASEHPTIVTTNLRKAEFAERYQNKRLYSRLREWTHWAELAEPDMRRARGGKP